MHSEIVEYIVFGRLPFAGDIIEAVVTNNLKEAVFRADDVNLNLIIAYVGWFYNHAPSLCWGSPEKMVAWHKQFQPDVTSAFNFMTGRL